MAARVSSPQFVGRPEELGTLATAFDQAVGGRAATVLVAGDAGIGKSRLLQEACERARQQGAVVAVGACIPVDGGGLLYGAAVGILRELARQTDAPAARALLERLTTGRAATDGGSTTARFEEFLAVVTAVAASRPVVLAVEDLHWADSRTAELTSFLVRNLGAAPVLFVGTYRADEVGPDHRLRPALAELARHPAVATVRLGGLDRDEMGAMIAGILGGPAGWALVDGVWARSQGNPFFAEELTAARDQQTLSPELQDVILARVAALSPPARRLLGLAAAAGPVLDHDLLVATGLLAEDALDAALGEIVDRQILVVVPDGSGYRFRHLLLREAVEGALLPGERRRLHGLLAHALEGSAGGARPDHPHGAEIAAHWWAAGAWAAALAASVAAADAAAAAWAFPEALQHLERAVLALDRLGAGDTGRPITRLELLARAAFVARVVGDWARATELARMAVSAADATTDPARLADCHLLHGSGLWDLGDAGGAFAAFQRARALVPADVPSAILARAIAEEARVLMLTARYHDAEARGEEALRVARAAGARAEEGHVLSTLAVCRGSLGFPADGLVLAREAVAIAEALGDVRQLNRAHANLASLLVQSGRLDEAAQLVFGLAATGEALWGVRLVGVASNGTEALVRLGRYDEAEALLAQAGLQAPGLCAAIQPPAQAALIALRRGDLDEAARLVAIVDALTEARDDVQWRGLFHLISAELALEQRRPGPALDHVERGLSLASGTDDEQLRGELHALAVRSTVDHHDDDRRRGLPADTAKALLQALDHVQALERMVAAPIERGGQPAPRLLGLLALAGAERSRLGAPSPAEWATAAERFEAAGERHPAAYCRWREAEAALAARADRSAAAASLRRAWEGSQALGARPLQAQIERLARRARIGLASLGGAEEADVAPSAIGDELGLTPREVEVLRQLAAGRTDREIADALFISKKTASVHVSNLLRKLAVPNRREAGRVGLAHGV